MINSTDLRAGVTFLYNGKPGREAEARRFFDELAVELVK